MPPVHEFGIIENFDRRKDYGCYAPKKYHCISVDDYLIKDLSISLNNMKTYFHSYNRPEFNLAYCGVTIIPPQSLSLFYDVVVSSVNFKKSDELASLATKIAQAREAKKYMIHFGI
ncbi:short-chain dehydrogenase [Anaerobacillus sp. CMMVII]|uniref:short-chain dehydrogenase n=1 Tax=Anaerobacillus sp. CMMVII TaxID=2755588 RepID=UPI0021B797DD|nr:short-chain dehydrogenase [Anaerobacillus sp. CMMVII]MCT8140311.1 short-chain dehydrogenase [Anaerobacillus sp. CMMVII]